MKRFTLRLCILITCLVYGCIGDCPREDHGTFELTVFNEKKEVVPNLQLLVLANRFSDWKNCDYVLREKRTVEELQAYFGGEIFSTDEHGHITGEVSYSDGASSCDGPSETFDNSFLSLILLYECQSGEMVCQKSTLDKEMIFENGINKTDTVFVSSTCVSN